MIELPDVTELSIGRAALAYVDAGIPFVVFDPRKGNGKACWNLLGYQEATIDKATIDSWRAKFGPFRSLALATSPGAFGAVVLDVDRPSEVPRDWREYLEAAPYVATRPKRQKRRGHYWFALPEGFPPVSSRPCEGGDVRSYRGGIVLPPYPNDNRHVVRAGTLPILPTIIAESLAVSRGADLGQAITVEAFCAKYQGNKYPGKLKGQVSIHKRKLAQMNPHAAMVYVLRLGLGEAALGFVPARTVLDTFHARWDRGAREFSDIARWCAAAVEASSASDLDDLEAMSRRSAGSDSRVYADRLERHGGNRSPENE